MTRPFHVPWYTACTVVVHFHRVCLPRVRSCRVLPLSGLVGSAPRQTIYLNFVDDDFVFFFCPPRTPRTGPHAQVSVQVKKQAQQEAEHFEGPVLEYGRMTTALKTALHKRNEKKITYMTAAHDLEAKKAHHSKVAGLGGDRQVRQRGGGRGGWRPRGGVFLENMRKSQTDSSRWRYNHSRDVLKPSSTRSVFCVGKRSLGGYRRTRGDLPHRRGHGGKGGVASEVSLSWLRDVDPAVADALFSRELLSHQTA